MHSVLSMYNNSHTVSFFFSHFLWVPSNVHVFYGVLCIARPPIAPRQPHPDGSTLIQFVPPSAVTTVQLLLSGLYSCLYTQFWRLLCTISTCSLTVTTSSFLHRGWASIKHTIWQIFLSDCSKEVMAITLACMAVLTSYSPTQQATCTCVLVNSAVTVPHH